MAKDQVRVAGVLSACILAGVAGVLWAQEEVPPLSPAEEESKQREGEAAGAELASEIAEEGQPRNLNILLEQLVLEANERASEAEEDTREEEGIGT
jgi:hypothetical protein